MWMLYLTIAIILSTGTGIYLSRDINIQSDDRARIQAPQIHAEQANQVARYLRRLYFADPTLFPPLPNNGQVAIPEVLVNQALAQGTRLPPGVTYVLRSDGNIVPLFAPDPESGDIRDNVIADTFNRVVEKDGVAPHLYGRRSGPIDRENTGTGSDSPIIATGPEFNFETNPRPIDENAEPTDGDGDTTTGGPGLELPVELPGTPENPETDPQEPGNTQDPGGNTGGGQGDSNIDEDEETLGGNLTVEDLVDGGGRGGSTNIAEDSFFIGGNGRLTVTREFVDRDGPRAAFYSAENVEGLVAVIREQQANGTYNQNNYLKSLYFDSESEAALQRIASEEEFFGTCQNMLNQAVGPLDERLNIIETNLIALHALNQNTTGNSIQEDVQTIGGAFIGSIAYCMSTMNARLDNIPVRAHRANFTNGQVLIVGQDFLTNFKNTRWYMQEEFLSVTPELTDLQNLIRDIEKLNTIINTYPAPGEFSTEEPPPPEPEPEPEPEPTP